MQGKILHGVALHGFVNNYTAYPGRRCALPWADLLMHLRCKYRFANSESANAGSSISSIAGASVSCEGARFMRLCLSAAIVLALTPSAFAQELDIDTVVRDWKKTLSGMKSCACVIERTSVDKAFNTKDEFRGQAFFRKAEKKGDGNLASLELTKTTNPNVIEKYIFTGSELHEYVFATKQVRVYKLPNVDQYLAQADLIGFAFGLGAEHVKERYHLELKKPKTPDNYYHYFLITPKTAHDKAGFTEARLALYRENNLPAQIWFLQPNRNEVTWNFTKIEVNVDIPANRFVPVVPNGWQVVPVTLPAVPPGKKQ
jgi:TIGR03009 family protein